LGDDKPVSQARQLFALCLAPFNVPGQVQLFSNRGAIDTPDLCQVEARQFVEPLALNAVGGPLLFPASGRAFLGLGPPWGRGYSTLSRIGTMLKIVPHNQTYVAKASSDVWYTTSVIPHLV